MQEPSIEPLTSNAIAYQLLKGEKCQFDDFPGYVDIRDVARAHILALNSIPQTAVHDGKIKRLVLASPYDKDWKEAIEFLLKERPSLKDRLASPGSKNVPRRSGPLNGIDYERVEEVLGMKRDEFRAWKETILDAVDSFVRIEEGWKSQGLEF
jgi:nucleoside-diphosphate-sugar epimerase